MCARSTTSECRVVKARKEKQERQGTFPPPPITTAMKHNSSLSITTLTSDHYHHAHTHRSNRLENTLACHRRQNPVHNSLPVSLTQTQHDSRIMIIVSSVWYKISGPQTTQGMRPSRWYLMRRSCRGVSTYLTFLSYNGSLPCPSTCP